MPRLPTPGGDDGTWGDLLNEYLGVAHMADGTEKEGTARIASGLDSGKPAAALSNRLYYATDTKILYRDTGTAWQELSRGETVTRHGSLSGIGPDDHHAQAHADSDHTGPSRVAILKAGTTIGTRPKLNLIEGSNVTLTVADDATNNEVDVTIAAAGGGGGGQWLPADYILAKDGTSYQLRNSAAGTVTTGTEPGALLQTALTALGAGGGTVVFGRGEFAWGSIPRLPRAITTKLTLRGTGTKINLSNAAPRFVDFDAKADAGLDVDITFQNIEIDNFIIDAGANQGLTEAHHLVIGNYRGGGGTKERQNYKNITVRNVEVQNIQTNDTGPVQYPIYLVTLHTAAGQPENFVENILIENCTFYGSRVGIQMNGGKYPNYVGDMAHRIDNVIIRNVRHILPSAPTVFGFSAHIHIGSTYSKVGKVVISDCYGYGSKDVGIEINNFQDVVIENTLIEDCYGLYFYSTNFSPPRRPLEQVYRVINCSGRNMAGKRDSAASGFWGYTVKNGNPMGRYIIEGFRGYTNIADLYAGGEMHGMAIRAVGEARGIYVNDFEYIHEGINHTSTTGATYIPILIGPTNQTPVALKNINVRITGTRQTTAGSLALYVIDHRPGSSAIVDYDNIRAHVDVANINDYGLRIMNFAQGTALAVKGTVRGLDIASVGTSVGARGLVIGSAANCTIEDQLRIEDCDFRGMGTGSGNADVLFTAVDENKDKVYFVGNKWRVFPRPLAGITVGASPFVYRNLNGYPVNIAINGGTVSAIDYSRDGTAYTAIGSASGLVVPVDNGDYIRVTYSAAPTMTAVPVK